MEGRHERNGRQDVVGQTRAESVYVSKGTKDHEIECLGKKRCPRGPNNSDRWSCCAYVRCLDAFILRRLRKRYLPLRLLKELRTVVNGPEEKGEYGVSDYALLIWIGKVSNENGYQFGRKSVDRAIRESNVPGDKNATAEGTIIRKIFGVHGREGMRRLEYRPSRANRVVE